MPPSVRGVSSSEADAAADAAAAERGGDDGGDDLCTHRHDAYARAAACLSCDIGDGGREGVGMDIHMI